MSIEFDKKISLGNVLQIGVIVIGIVGMYFALKYGQAANTVAIERNTIAIQKLVEDSEGNDVLEYKVDQLTESVARIEKKLDD